MHVHVSSIINVSRVLKAFTELLGKRGYAVDVEVRRFAYQETGEVGLGLKDLLVIFADRLVCDSEGRYGARLATRPDSLAGTVIEVSWPVLQAEVAACLSYASVAEEEGNEHLPFSYTLRLPPERTLARSAALWAILWQFITLPPTAVTSLFQKRTVFLP